MKFSEQLKEFRDRLKFTQCDLAKKLKVTQGTISTWEKDICLPSIILVKKLIKIGNKKKENVDFLEARLQEIKHTRIKTND
jgi:DNA-binding XRE family transcriptional regulator